jgi:serine/threonine protein kinase
MAHKTFTPLSEYLHASQQEWESRLSFPENDQDAVRQMAELPVSVEDRYQILKTIHEGPHSRIYEVRDTLLGRIIALKQINKTYPDHDTYLHQMKERTALAHPNILRIYDIDDKRGQIAMEYVQGLNLRSMLHLKGALTIDLVMYIAIQLVNGLHHAHSNGVIHHALTPEHILLDRRCALKLIGFRAPDSFMRLQKLDDPSTCLYIPPELFCHKELTVASNIFSFGVIVYEMCTGNGPFSAKQINDGMQSREEWRYDESLLPAGLHPIIRRCLAREPEQRYTAIRTVGKLLICWYEHIKRCKTCEENLNTYKDFLLMTWADGKITEEEAAFLAYKRKELHISGAEAQQAEAEVKQELEELLHV